MSLSYQGEGDYSNPDYLTNQTGKNRSKSSVFREGDYNMTSLNTDGHFLSTQMKDYVQSEVTASSNKEDDGT